MANIKHLIAIDADASKVYEAIATQNGQENWWTDDCTVKPEIGFVNEFRFGNHVKNIEVVNLEENKRVEWKCIAGDEEWIGTTISFEIIENNGACNLRFTHNKWKEQTDYFGVCSYHWARFLTSLKSYIETGVGQPFQSQKVNNN